MPTEKLTLTFAGHEFTLIAGRRYLAARPMLGEPGHEDPTGSFPVWVTDITPDPEGPFGDTVLTIDGLSLAEADALLTAFNDRGPSWQGRVWGEEGEPTPWLVEEGDFSDEDFAAADRARARIAAGEVDNDVIGYKVGEMGSGEPDPDLHRFYGHDT